MAPGTPSSSWPPPPPGSSPPRIWRPPPPPGSSPVGPGQPEPAAGTVQQPHLGAGAPAPRRRLSWTELLGIAVSITTLIGFALVVYDRVRPTGPPSYREAIDSAEAASEFAEFLRDHDGRVVELVVDCHHGEPSRCYTPDPEVGEMFETTFDTSYFTLNLFEGEPCEDVYDCPDSWFLFFDQGETDGDIYDTAGAGTIRVTGYWRVKQGGLSSIVGPRTFELTSVEQPVLGAGVSRSTTAAATR